MFYRENPQHGGGAWRLKAVGTRILSLAVDLTRTVAMLLVATLLILVLLPAVLAANGG